ncbi:tyrosine-type recombinase/integrase [Draconibacterium sp.]|uniref:tyrosine-type recombinase/integrase n=1 Tax=Draconibacterium sp. TaxID=1965318 RepID=UPI003561CA98
MIGITTAIILDKRIKTKKDTYAVKLRITFNRVQKYYPVNVHLTTDEWKKVHSEKPRKTYKDHLVYFNGIENKAIEIIKDLNPFSFPEFERKFNQKPKAEANVLTSFDDYITKLKNEDRAGTAESYTSALNSFKEYLKTKNRKKLNFWDVTPDWLDNYEKWMINEGKSITSVGIYLRNLRTIFNRAIEDGLINNSIYPFGKRKYQIPAGRNVKKALQLVDIGKIVKYTPKTDNEEKARDLWLFSYLCNGANIKDIALLQYKNIKGNKIYFLREKTKRSTKQDQKEVTVVLLPEVKKIIEKWGEKPQEPETYIFGIIKKDDDAKTVLMNVRQATKTINKYMKRIGEELEFPLKLTTYTARHSFATILKREGASMELISENLGHKDLRTTQNYLDSFEDEIKESFQKKLLNF